MLSVKRQATSSVGGVKIRWTVLNIILATKTIQI